MQYFFFSFVSARLELSHLEFAINKEQRKKICWMRGKKYGPAKSLFDKN